MNEKTEIIKEAKHLFAQLVSNIGIRYRERCQSRGTEPNYLNSQDLWDAMNEACKEAGWIEEFDYDLGMTYYMFKSKNELCERAISHNW